MIGSVFIAGQIKCLGECGYIESAATAEWFQEYFLALKNAHPKARFVEGVGEHAIGQITFLPRMKTRVRMKLKGELARLEKAVAGTKKALASMDA